MVAPRTSRQRFDRVGRGGSAGLLRILGWGVLGLLLLGFVLVVFAVPATLGVRQRFEDGRQAMEQARAAVVRGETGRALDRFEAAKISFDEAVAQTGSGVLGIASWTPFLGSNVDVVGALARAGGRTAQAGIEVAQAVEAEPGGVDALAPANGRIPLEPFPTLTEAVGRAHSLVAAALAEVRSSTTSALLPPVGDARSKAESSLEDLDTTLGAAAGMLRRLPAFLGADGVRTYLFGAENPAELRGTGGLIGAYSILRAEDGRLSFAPFRPIQQLPHPDMDTLEPPNPDYHRLYDPQREGVGFWLNANMTPDFPSAAQALETAFEAVEHRAVDGVITADPFALRALLQATGPTEVRSLGVRITADSVVGFLANRAYAHIRYPPERKRVLGSVAESVVQRFLDGARSSDAVRSVAEAAGEGHIKVYADDPDLQAALEDTGAGGALPAGSSDEDLLSVVVNNGAGNKVDYYVEREVRSQVVLDADGGASTSTAVVLRDEAPSGGLPAYILGPSHGVTDRPGQELPILNLYCGRCRITSASRNGSEIDPGVDHELGSNFGQDYFTIDPGETTTTQFRYEVRGAWSGAAGGGTYTLRFLNQSTIRPTTVHIAVRVPDGMHVTNTSGGMQVDGSTATWTGTPGRALTLDVSFAPPLPQRLWHSLVG